MASLTNNATVTAGNGLGSKTYICAVTTGTVSVADACAEIQAEGGTIVGVTGTAGATEYVAVQGGEAPSVTGVAVTATFED